MATVTSEAGSNFILRVREIASLLPKCVACIVNSEHRDGALAMTVLHTKLPIAFSLYMSATRSNLMPRVREIASLLPKCVACIVNSGHRDGALAMTVLHTKRPVAFSLYKCATQRKFNSSNIVWPQNRNSNKKQSPEKTFGATTINY